MQVLSSVLGPGDFSTVHTLGEVARALERGPGTIYLSRRGENRSLGWSGARKLANGKFRASHLLYEL